MSSTLTNSLLLLNEIRDHLKHSKSNLQNEVSPTKKFGKPTTSYRPRGYDTDATIGSITTEEEPLRVQLNRRIDPNLHKSPPISQKIKIEDEEGSVPETSHSKASRIINASISPNKRKASRTRGNEDFNVEKFSRKSQQLAENLKRLINEEIENFSNECDILRQKLQGMLDERPNKGYNESAGISKSALRGAEYGQREEGNDNKLNQITQKIEKLMEDIDEKKVGMSNTVKESPGYDFGTFSGNPSPFKPGKSMPVRESHSKY